MAAYNKFQITVQDIARKVHNFNADTFKLLLTNSAPVNTNAVKADITEIAAGNGYSAGGPTVGTTAATQTAGVLKFTGANVTVTAAGGPIGPFRYVVLYNSTPGAGPLIAWFDFGSNLTLADTDSFTVAWDATNGIFTIT